MQVQGVLRCTNQVLHPWLKQQLAQIVQALAPQTSPANASENRALWQHWREHLSLKFTLPAELPPLRVLLVCDNLAGHKTPELVLWFCAHGILPLYTPLGGSWLNMAESIQRILKRRALGGQVFQTPQQIITNLEQVAQAWNQHPTPFVWGGKRALRRQRARNRQSYRLAGSGACTTTLLPPIPSATNGYPHAN